MNSFLISMPDTPYLSRRGLRVRYEIRRKFAPYVGLNQGKSYRDTREFLEAAGGDTSSVSFLAVLRFWF